jgi:hypothetical protein
MRQAVPRSGACWKESPIEREATSCADVARSCADVARSCADVARSCAEVTCVALGGREVRPRREQRVRVLLAHDAHAALELEQVRAAAALADLRMRYCQTGGASQCSD